MNKTKLYIKPEMIVVDFTTKETILSYSSIHPGEESDGTSPMSIEPNNVWNMN